MIILVSVDTLQAGGVETFTLRFAEELSKNHTVYIYYNYWDRIEPTLVRQLAPSIKILSFKPFYLLDKLIWKLNGLGLKLGFDFSIRELFKKKYFKYLVNKYRIELVHSHWFSSDKLATQALAASPIPIVISMHGAYELNLEDKVYHPNFISEAEKVLNQASAIVYLTDKNLKIFSSINFNFEKTPLKKIYNGFVGKLSENTSKYTRSTLGIDKEATVFGMVARGAANKGWLEAIESFLQIEESGIWPIHLVLIGDGEYLSLLKAKYESYPTIHFLGYQPNPIDWVTIFDIGLLPTYFIAESLPSSIIEYLYLNKPVIASNIGEIPKMLEDDGIRAGIVINLNNNLKVDKHQLINAMMTYLKKPELRVEHSKNAGILFEKFNMNKCIQEYEKVFELVVSKSSENT